MAPSCISFFHLSLQSLLKFRSYFVFFSLYVSSENGKRGEYAVALCVKYTNIGKTTEIYGTLISRYVNTSAYEIT